MRKILVCTFIGLLLLTGCVSNKKSNGISENNAIQIALKEVGITENETSMIRTTKEITDNDYAYKIEFHYDGKEYEYVVGSNGEIFRSEKRTADKKESIKKTHLRTGLLKKML